MKSDLIDIKVKLHHETAKAILVSDDGDLQRAVWIAKSQCEIEAKGAYHELTLPEWLAKEKGFI